MEKILSSGPQRFNILKRKFSAVEDVLAFNVELATESLVTLSILPLIQESRLCYPYSFNKDMEKILSSGPQNFNILKRKFSAIEDGEDRREEIKSVKKRLLSAIEIGDNNTTTRIIETKVRTSTDSGHQMVNLGFIRAALAGDENMVSFLLTKGADIKYVRDDGITPLKAAILSNSYTTVETLLRCGAKARIPSTFKVDSPLHIALKGGFIPNPIIGSDKWDNKFLTDTKIIKLLIDNGALANQKSSDGFLPLSLAASSNRDSVVNHLIKKGADVNQVDVRFAMTPLMHACIAGNVQIVKILLNQWADINVTDKWDYSPLMLAAQFKRDRVVSTLLQWGAEVNQPSNFDGKNALLLATECKNCDIVNTLLGYGADVNYIKPIHRRGTTALMIAASLGYRDIVETLIDFGADVDMKDLDDQTAISLCSTPDILKILTMSDSFYCKF
ncbi:hypothetical protein Btru_072944 [Bulinus truncatus]|nr:hypothetical protein Btru_072944 [Bulinus truncatus]